MFFGQEFHFADLGIIALLVILEGTLSIDNALVLGLLAKRLPKHQQKKALTYGLVGAFVFRFIAIAAATFLLKWTIFKLLGGAYLLWVAIKHFFFEHKDSEHDHIQIGPDGNPILKEEVGGDLESADREREIAGRSPLHARPRSRPLARFWPTVFVIEMTDIAFAVDSIVAAIGMVPMPKDLPADQIHPKLWVIIIGGFLGVVVMRFAAVLFIKMLEKFPRFEIAAYLLVVVIGLKLVVDWAFNTPEHHRVDFHSPKYVSFWIFWGLMVAAFAIGFIPKKKPPLAAAAG
jgi:YkoY family integral membrane protein